MAVCKDCDYKGSLGYTVKSHIRRNPTNTPTPATSHTSKQTKKLKFWDSIIAATYMEYGRPQRLTEEFIFNSANNGEHDENLTIVGYVGTPLQTQHSRGRWEGLCKFKIRLATYQNILSLL